MKKITNQFWKYTITLLIVGAILVLIGGLSVGRTTIASRRELNLDMSARTKVEVVSNENMELKAQNAKLLEEKEQAIADKVASDKKAKTLEAYVLLEQYMQDGDTEKAAEQLALIDQTLLPEAVLEQFEEYADALKANEE